MSRWAACVLMGLMAVSAGSVQADQYVVKLDPDLEAAPRDGRVILFFITETGRQWDRREPMNAPFYSSPQPVASIAVERFGPGDSILIDDSVFVFPRPLREMGGRARVQAVFDHDQTERSHESGPGNLSSEVLTVELSPEREDRFELTLSNVVRGPSLPAERENLKWVEWRSEMLSEFYGRDVYHRAGVALPPGYHDEDRADVLWPAQYVIPGFGGRHEMAQRYATTYGSPAAAAIVPLFVTIVLDPESPLGHHGFVDSENHGPRGTALVEEFIPHLESEFRLVSETEARVVTGHSSGGWSSLWLQLNWPEVFGACWSSAPDPIDFSAFQKTNLYEDESMYVMPNGEETPSYRMRTREGREVIAMTVRQEVLVEYAMHPAGGSGQQWDAWMAMFSPRDPETGYPKRMFDPKTGRINREVVEHWKPFDITRRVGENWEKYGPIVSERVRLVCGARDCYYLNRAVDRFAAMIEEHRDGEKRPGYVHMHPWANHNNIDDLMARRWYPEQRAYLKQHGLDRSGR